MKLSRIKHLLLIFFLLQLLGCQNPENSNKPTITGEFITPPFLTVINGLSENLSFIKKSGDNLVESNIPTGQAPNQIFRYNDKVYIVNSLSNSITVYNYKSFSLINEFSTGTGTNPYKAVIGGDKIYITAYLSHQLLIFNPDGSNKQTIGLSVLNENGKCYYPFPQGIAMWNDYIFAACMYSEENGASKTRNPGRVAVYSIKANTITGYIDPSANDTNSLYIDSNTLYIISSGSYDSGFDETGTIESVNLAGVNLDSPGVITPVLVADGNSFGAFCISGNKAWTGNLGNGSLRAFDTSTVPWRETGSRLFSGGYGMAYIPDIKYSANKDELYLTEFNGNTLYILDPGDLSTIKEYRCSSNQYGDAQFMLLLE